MASAATVLEIRGLRREFAGREVLGGLDASMRAGERVALVGPNGAGKSTVLRCVSGTVLPSAGTVTIGGHSAGSLAARRLLGVSLSQERSFYLRLSGRENLTFFARARGAGSREARGQVDALESELELGEVLAQRVDRCSTGMVLQLSFARALLSDPPLLLLDEPTRSLDEEAAARLWGALERRPQTAVLLATHREEDVERCGSSIRLPL